MFNEPIGGWRRVSISETRKKDDWAMQIKRLVDEDYPDAKKIILVCDNLNTHNISSLYQAFPPSEARRIWERIELHHIGQDPDAPLAELTEDSEHGEYTSELHKSEEESWRKDEPQRNNYYNNVERPNHWIERSKGG